MSSPGSGKTTTLRGIIGRLQQEMRIGVMEADIDSDVDAKTIAETGVRAIQLHTGGMCHLDAGMTRQGVENLGTADLDLVFLENVGNLVCPAEFDTGAAKKYDDPVCAGGGRQASKVPADVYRVRCGAHQQDGHKERV